MPKNLYTCANNHEEIYFESGKCPLCEVLIAAGVFTDQMAPLVQELADKLFPNNKHRAETLTPATPATPATPVLVKSGNLIEFPSRRSSGGDAA